MWNWQDLTAAPKEYATAGEHDATWTDHNRIIEPEDRTEGPNKAHWLVARNPQTGKSDDMAKLGVEWYVEKLASSRDGQHHACLLAFDSVIGDVITSLGKQTYYAVGVINAQKLSPSWVKPIIHRNRNGGLTLSALAVSEDGEYVAVVGCDGSGGWVHVVAPGKGKSLWERVPDGSNAFGGVAFAPDGKTLYAAGTEGAVYAFETATGRILSCWPVQEGKEIRYGERITSLAASSDGRFVAAGLGPTGDVHVWAVSTGKVVLSLTTGQATVYRLAFSPDSKFLAANGVNGRTIQVWSLPVEATATKPAATIFDLVTSGKVAELDRLLDDAPKSAAARDGYGRTPLHWAMLAGREVCAGRLLKAGADVNARDLGGWTPLHYWAAGEGSREVALLVLSKGADLKAQTGGPKQWSPLHLAAARGQVEAAKELIAQGAVVNASNGYHHTPLHLAADFGHVEVVRLLVEHKADMTAKTRYGGDMPIHLAAKQGFAEVVEVLLAAGAKVDSLDENRSTALIDAAEMNQPKVAKVLLENGAVVERLTAHGMPLHIAARDGSKELIKLLLEHGAGVNAKDKNGWTPLRWARRHLTDARSARLQERKEAEAVLLEHGAKE
ncbi:MAG: ankyrin repeat domain-containing protein [Phycisphaerae bacterium]|nr:ankyrin repeat domain-containing protein [Phycisphaerae bacterium]